MCAGQLWGSPLYKWDEHRKQNYEWWASRLGRAFELYDETRIDHFRGFAGAVCWPLWVTQRLMPAETPVLFIWVQGARQF